MINLQNLLRGECPNCNPELTHLLWSATAIKLENWSFSLDKPTHTLVSFVLKLKHNNMHTIGLPLDFTTHTQVQPEHKVSAKRCRNLQHQLLSSVSLSCPSTLKHHNKMMLLLLYSVFTFTFSTFFAYLSSFADHPLVVISWNTLF